MARPTNTPDNLPLTAPLQAAYKAAGGVFYWNLHAPALRTLSGAVETTTSLNAKYDEWVKGVEANYDDGGKKPAKFLVGTTRRANIDRWERFTARVLFNENVRKKREKDSRLDEGEIRIELNSLRLNKIGCVPALKRCHEPVKSCAHT